MSQAHGIIIKKQFGQHFLRDRSIVQNMCEHVDLISNHSVFEIGCGDGILTGEILAHPIDRLWVFEIDPEWANFVKNKFKDPRMQMYHENFLDADLSRLQPYKPWVLLANLPYQVTFPILHRLYEFRALISHGVIMVQEEVAQKIVRTSGRGYGYSSLFFQYYFEWEMLTKIPPGAFLPPPKVFSRLLYFKTKENVAPIAHEDAFWNFIKVCFKQPRRTLRNNLVSSHYPLHLIPEQTLQLRAQQMAMPDFLKLWDVVYTGSAFASRSW